MKRFIAFVGLLLALVGSAVVPSSALAANSTCTTHQLSITDYAAGAGTVDYHWDFKCGGANNEDYQVDFRFQWKDGGGAWHTFDCDNGLPCLLGRPGLLAYYNGGTEHAGNETFSTVGTFNCATIRVHATVIFADFSPDINVNSQTINTPC